MYTLPESLTIRNVKSIRDELICYLEHQLETGRGKEKETPLNFLQLKDIDTAGLQLLLSAAVSSRNNNCPLRVVNVQPPIRELLLVTGAGDILTPDNPVYNAGSLTQ